MASDGNVFAPQRWCLGLKRTMSVLAVLRLSRGISKSGPGLGARRKAVEKCVTCRHLGMVEIRYLTDYNKVIVWLPDCCLEQRSWFGSRWSVTFSRVGSSRAAHSPKYFESAPPSTLTTFGRAPAQAPASAMTTKANGRPSTMRTFEVCKIKVEFSSREGGCSEFLDGISWFLVGDPQTVSPSRVESERHRIVSVV